MKNACVFILLATVGANSLSQSYSRDSTFDLYVWRVPAPAMEYRDFVFLIGIGSGEIVYLSADVQLFRGLYGTLGTGASFVPFQTSQLLNLSPQVNCGLSWRMFSAKFTPIITVQGSKAFWTASYYNAKTNMYDDVARNALLFTPQVGVEYRSRDGGVLGLLVGEAWWKANDNTKTNKLILQLYGGLSY